MGAKGGWANGLRFDGDATDKTGVSESTFTTASLPVVSAPYDLPYSSANQTDLAACKAQAQTTLEGALTPHTNMHTNTHCDPGSLAPLLVAAPLNSGGGPIPSPPLWPPLSSPGLQELRRSHPKGKTKETAASARQR